MINFACFSKFERKVSVQKVLTLPTVEYFTIAAILFSVVCSVYREVQKVDTRYAIIKQHLSREVRNVNHCCCCCLEIKYQKHKPCLKD